MKRHNNLFNKLIAHDNLALALENASKGKKDRKVVKRCLDDTEGTIARLQTILQEGAYTPCWVKERIINDSSKVRTITSTDFYPDQIIHWALIQVLQPIILPTFYPYTLATIKGRGSSLGKRKLESWLKGDRKNTKYCLKIDITHYYQSINHQVLKEALTQKIKDYRYLNILFSIIDSYPSGLPLGLYTSQWLANLYLSRIDHLIKEQLRVKYYLRYMDDMVMLGGNKRESCTEFLLY